MNYKPRWLKTRWARAAGPVLPLTAFGAAWIVLHATAGRGGTHTLFQFLALAEATTALLLRGRKPVGALAGILAAYAVTDLAAILIGPVLLALATAADRRGRRVAVAATAVTALVVLTMPVLHGDRVSVLAGELPSLAAVLLAAGLGAWIRANRHPVIAAPSTGLGAAT